MFRRLIWLEVAALLLALVLLEMGVVMLELRTAIIVDWFVSLAPLIWINVSAVSLYAFFRQLYGSNSGVGVPEGRSTSACRSSFDRTSPPFAPWSTGPGSGCSGSL